MTTEMQEGGMPASWSVEALGEVVDSVRETAKIAGNQAYELWSIPSFSEGAPERVVGSEIGSGKLLVRPDDVLISKINPRINRVWAVSEPPDGFIQVASTEWIVARIGAAAGLLPRFLEWYATSPAFRQMIEQGVQGVTGSHTRAKTPQVLRLPVPIPPLAEQQRIVEILEEQLSRLDAALDSVRVVREKAAQFRRSLLHAAFAGPLSRLGADTPLSAGPRLIRLGEVVSSVRNGITYKNAPDSGGLPIARIQTIANGAIDFAKVGYAGLEEVDAKHLLEPGDILFSHINSQAHVGKVALYRPEMQALVHGMNLLRLRPKDSMHPTYLFYALQSPEVRGQVWARTRHAVNQASINIKALSDVRIPAPPPADQQRIVEVLEGQLSQLDASLPVADTIEKRSAALRRSLLHAAFTGRLTEQWRERAHV